MVTVTNYKAYQNEAGKTFYKLELQGEAQAVQSQTTGKFYLKARTCMISTTFDEATCKRMIGTTMFGTIRKVETEPYEYTDQETGELLTLTHRWEYDPFDLAEQHKPVSQLESLI